MRWFRSMRRLVAVLGARREAVADVPKVQTSSQATRQRLVAQHDEQMRRERLLAEERRRAGAVGPTTPASLGPGRGWEAGLNRE